MLIDSQATGLLEEGSPGVVIVQDVGLIVQSPGEDFAGSLPAEEQSIATAVVSIEAGLSTFIFAEDFAGSLPADEQTTSVLVAGVDAVSSVAVIGEDFAGSLPADEASVFVAVTITDAPLSFIFGEDFAGSLPAEEYSTWIPIYVQDASTVFFVGEDFAGSVQLEEGIGSVFISLDVSTVSIIPLPEDFAGSLAVDEAGAWLPIAVVDTWMTWSWTDESLPIVPVPPPPPSPAPLPIPPTQIIQPAPVVSGGFVGGTGGGYFPQPALSPIEEEEPTDEERAAEILYRVDLALEEKTEEVAGLPEGVKIRVSSEEVAEVVEKQLEEAQPEERPIVVVAPQPITVPSASEKWKWFLTGALIGAAVSLAIQYVLDRLRKPRKRRRRSSRHR